MEAEQFRRLGFKNPIAVIPNGVTLPEHSTLSRSDAPADKYALFLSRLHPKKGLLDLVEAWRQVRPERWTLLIAGPSEGDHEQAVREAVRNAGLDECVQFLGALDDREKWDVYAKSQLFVLPTLSENFGVVVAEALGAEVPVITTKAAPWSLLQEEDCGWWIETGVTPLVQALRQATDAPSDHLHRMGQRGRAAVLKRFDWTRIGEQMVAVYNWLLGIGPEPDTLFAP
jgi:glycosyltransferase involved in cell wall biosynthesis